MKFYLHSPSSESSSIFLDAAISGFRIRTATGIIILSKNWDADKQKVLNKEPKYQSINNRLSIIRSKIDDFVSEAKLQRKKYSKEDITDIIDTFIFPNKEKIKESTLEKLSGLEEKQIFDFFDEFEKFISLRENSKNFKASTIKSYRRAFNIIKEFSEYSKINISFETVNKELYDKMLLYFRTKKGLVNNSIGAIIKVMKTFLFYALEKNMTSNTEFAKKDVLKVFKEEINAIALDEQDIELILNADLKPSLEKIRDLFILQIETALRVSDLFNIKPEHIDLKNAELRIYQIKTAGYLRIPLSRRSLEIINKYDCNLPKMSHQKYNDYLKIVCKAAGLDNPIETFKMIGAKRITSTVPKYELISSHTARRTGATILIKAGIPPEIVMKITGHKSMATFQKYVKIAQEQAIDTVRAFWNRD